MNDQSEPVEKLWAEKKQNPIDSMKMPDLENGFIILNLDCANRWYTGIECVLARQAPGETDPQRAFLSQECRAELVNEDPYSHPGMYEYVAISTWDGNYALRSGPMLAGVRGPADGDTVRPDASYEKVEMRIAVTCPERDVRQIPFDELKQSLQTDFAAGYRKPYMAISYWQGENAYTLVAPCRYINFPHPTKADRSYLQPISGYVLYEKDGKFFTAYVVTYIEDGNAKSVQFKVRDRYSAGDLATHEFCREERIENPRMTCEFFAYE